MYSRFNDRTAMATSNEDEDSSNEDEDFSNEDEDSSEAQQEEAPPSVMIPKEKKQTSIYFYRINCCAIRSYS
jgi:hypothetical protein